MGRLAGRTALITGAARGIGYAICRRFAAEGARLALTDIDEEGVRAAAQALGSASGAEHLWARIHVADVAAQRERHVGRGVPGINFELLRCRGCNVIEKLSPGARATAVNRQCDEDGSFEWDQIRSATEQLLAIGDGQTPRVARDVGGTRFVERFP